MSSVIKVENVSKLYNLNDVGVATIKSDLVRMWAKWRGKEDPAFKLAEANDRTQKGSSEFVWALKDINFEVEQGEVLGILGKNGAGKSTLLKILSRVAAPTTGQIKMRGRLASLLEVGTGFHPDLSGRENIFLNGSILGMTKSEIKKNFDEIVNFSGVERYIDTPVKRYSSGMYVRLAFAVAAHLEPEILIIDEVLAVGDAEFQKKCLGKIKDVSGQGRTVLFVTHNITALKSLCNRIVWLEHGLIKETGDTNTILDKYLEKAIEITTKRDLTWPQNEEAPGNENIRFSKAGIDCTDAVIRVSSSLTIYFEFECFIETELLNISMFLFTREEVCVFNTGTTAIKGNKGKYSARCHIPANLLNDEFYRVQIIIVKDTTTWIFNSENILGFEVSEIERQGNWYGKMLGAVRPQLKWEFNQIG